MTLSEEARDVDFPALFSFGKSRHVTKNRKTNTSQFLFLVGERKKYHFGPV